MLVTLIADDLTGACDAGATFAGRSRTGVFVAPRSPGSGWEIAAVDTESRDLPRHGAAATVAASTARLAERLAGGFLFKKIDSTLRGAVGSELEALLSASGRETALVCPAFPGQARTVVGGLLRVGGRLAHESAIGRDPAYPGPTSDVGDILRRGARRPLSLLPLRQVRGGRLALIRALEGARGGIAVADAETDADLDELALAALACPGAVLVGSAGLACAAATALGHGGPPPPLPEGRAWLIVAGSLHPATRDQLRAIDGVAVGVEVGAADPRPRELADHLDSGRPVFITTPAVDAGRRDRRETASRLAELAARVLDLSRPDLVAVTGGETAVALLRALGAEQIEISGAPASGLALGLAVLGDATTIPLLTKAGGFGAPDLFLTLLRPALAASSSPAPHRSGHRHLVEGST